MFLPLKNEKYFFRISNNLPSSFHDILVPAPLTPPPAGLAISPVRAV